MTRQSSFQQELGYTVIEILIAVSIFAVVSVAAYGALDGLSKATEATDAHAEDLAELQYVFARLSSDIQSLVAKPRFDELQPQKPMFFGQSTQWGGLRSGWANPLNQPRAQLQRFMWRRSGESLERLYWPRIYDDQSSPQVDLVFDQVLGLSVRYLGANGAWQDRWDSQLNEPLPRAIELNLDHRRFGRVRRLWVLE